MKEVDFLIIGAGISGIVLRKFLANQNTVQLDPAPGGYKIGESIIPEHFHNLIVREQMPKIKQLPSYTPKWGTTFVTKDKVAAFPLPKELADIAMHIERSQLEQMMIEDWGLDIIKEKVLDIDFENKIVKSDKNSYKVNKQIIDCSGPAMVIATILGERHPIIKTHCSWAYFDVVKIDDSKYWEDIRKKGKLYLRLNVPSGKLIKVKDDPNWRPSRTTCLTQLDDGVWSWQIPLYDSTRLSFGIVNRHKHTTKEELYELAKKHHAPQYTLEPRPLDNSSDLNKFYVRDNFAQAANKASTKDYILIADAFAFADPIYSVGTGLAVNKAIQVAQLLNEGDWTEEIIQKYNAQYDELIKAAVDGFNFWYTGELLENDEVAKSVQEGLLKGEVFVSGLSQHYSQSVISSFGDVKSKEHYRWPKLSEEKEDN